MQWVTRAAKRRRFLQETVDGDDQRLPLIDDIWSLLLRQFLDPLSQMLWGRTCRAARRLYQAAVPTAARPHTQRDVVQLYGKYGTCDTCSDSPLFARSTCKRTVENCRVLAYVALYEHRNADVVYWLHYVLQMPNSITSFPRSIERWAIATGLLDFARRFCHLAEADVVTVDLLLYAVRCDAVAWLAWALTERHYCADEIEHGNAGCRLYFEAVRHNRASIIVLLCAKGVPLGGDAERGARLFGFAVGMAHVTTLTLSTLVAHGFGPASWSKSPANLLLRAARTGRLETLVFLHEVGYDWASDICLLSPDTVLSAPVARTVRMFFHYLADLCYPISPQQDKAKVLFEQCYPPQDIATGW